MDLGHLGVREAQQRHYVNLCHHPMNKVRMSIFISIYADLSSRNQLIPTFNL